MEYTKKELENLKTCLMYIMKDIHRVCVENDIRYFCYGGTMLGAVRHKGFIPWDDDMDICMPRPDYERFMQIADAKLKEDLFVENYKNTKGYGHPFGKVMLKGTVWKENFTEKVDCHKNIYVDVFPLDCISSDPMRFKWDTIRVRIIQRMLLLNCSYKYTKKGIKKILYRMGYWFSKKWKKETLISLWEKLAIKDEKLQNGQYTIFSGVYPIGREVVLKDEIQEFTEMPFEDTEFVVPKAYDAILKRMYGDYMVLPPKEKQVSHHNLIEIDFGEYGV